MTSSESLPYHITHDDRGPVILAVCGTLTGIATLFVAARLYVRSRILSRFGLDDWLIIISMMCGYLMLALTIVAVKAGHGRHFAALTDKQKSDTILYTLAALCPGIFSFGVPKLAVVALLIKITNPSRKHKFFLWGLSGGCMLILCGCIFVIWAQCSPVRSAWDSSVKGTCWSKKVSVYNAIVATSISAAVDVYLAIYPAFVLYNLQMRWQKKLALCAALALGSIAAAVAIYKSTRLHHLASDDFSYDASDVTIWTSIEGNSIIIAACIPTLQPLLDLVFGKGFLGSSRDKNSRSDMRAPYNIELTGNASDNSTSKHKKMGKFDVSYARDSEERILGVNEETTITEDKISKSGSPETWIQCTHETTIVYEDLSTKESTKVRREDF